MNPCVPCFYLSTVGLPAVLILLVLCMAAYMLYLQYRGPRTKRTPTWERILPIPSLSGSISYPESCLSFNLENWETSTKRHLPIPSLSGSISYPESCLSFNLENWETSTKRHLPIRSLSGSISYPESCLSFNLENWETSTRKSEDCYRNEDDVRIAVGDRFHFLRHHYYNENIVQGANF